MADLVLIPANVLPGDGAQYTTGTAGATIAAGDVCTLDTTTGRVVPADSSGLATSRVRGIAGHPAVPGQPVRLQTGGQMRLGAGLLVVGQLYALSGATPGKIVALGEVLAGDFVTVLGVAETADLLQLRLWSTGLAHG